MEIEEFVSSNYFINIKQEIENLFDKQINQGCFLEFLKDFFKPFYYSPMSIYILDHFNDPPYDHSGELVKVGQLDPLQQNKINLLKILEYYSGDCRPTYSSNYGFFYNSFGQKLYEEYSCYISRKIKEITDKHFLLNEEIDKNEIDEYDFVEVIEEELYDEIVFYRYYFDNFEDEESLLCSFFMENNITYYSIYNYLEDVKKEWQEYLNKKKGTK